VCQFSAQSDVKNLRKMMHISRKCLLAAAGGFIAHCTLGAVALDGRPYTCRHLCHGLFVCMRRLVLPVVVEAVMDCLRGEVLG